MKMRITLFVTLAALLGCSEDPTDHGLASEPTTPEPEPVDPQPEPEGLVIDQVIDEPPSVETPEPGRELPANVVREFACTPEGVGDELVVGKVAGTIGDVVVIRPAVRDECRYDLIYKAATGEEQVLSGGVHSGYLLTLAAAFPDGRAVVCTNDVRHSAVGGSQRFMDEIVIVCTTRRAGSAWTPLRDVIVPDEQWAAWVRGLDQRDDGTITLRYTRDFSFQFMNLTDEGRPAEDGVYEVELLTTETGVTASDAVKLSDTTNPLKEGTLMKEWTPTAEEEEVMGEFVTFGDGPCPHGCVGLAPTPSP